MSRIKKPDMSKILIKDGRILGKFFNDKALSIYINEYNVADYKVMQVVESKSVS